MSKDRNIDDADLKNVTGAGDEHLKESDYVPGVPVGGTGTKPPAPPGGGGGGGNPGGIEGDADTGGDQEIGPA